MTSYVRRISTDRKTASVFTHLTSWWSQRDNDQVMLLCYEDMLRDSEATMHAVAQFIGIDADEALIAKTLE